MEGAAWCRRLTIRRLASDTEPSAGRQLVDTRERESQGKYMRITLALMLIALVTERVGLRNSLLHLIIILLSYTYGIIAKLFNHKVKRAFIKKVH